MANEECGGFGLKARFARNAHGVCPLLTPIAAQFTCKPALDQAITQSPGPQPGALFQGKVLPNTPGSVLPPSATRFGAEDVSTTAKSAPYPTFLFNGQQTRP